MPLAATREAPSEHLNLSAMDEPSFGERAHRAAPESDPAAAVSANASDDRDAVTRGKETQMVPLLPSQNLGPAASVQRNERSSASVQRDERISAHASGSSTREEAAIPPRRGDAGAREGPVDAGAIAHATPMRHLPYPSPAPATYGQDVIPPRGPRGAQFSPATPLSSVPPRPPEVRVSSPPRPPRLSTPGPG